MPANEVKVFYSWQSDLPGNETRSLIQSGIDAAVKAMRNTVEIVADRDTKNVPGTPDIPATIFSKIADSDIFVADISIVNKYSTFDESGNIKGNIKFSPNPNVLLELGYAAALLGWDNIICIIDTDYGQIEDLPFDLDHRRPFAYSLNGREKGDIRKSIRDLVVSMVSDVIENGPRARAGYSNLTLAVFDFLSSSIRIDSLPKLRVRNLPGYEKYIREQSEKCKTLIQDILDSQVREKNNSEYVRGDSEPPSTIDDMQRLIKRSSEPHPVVIDDDERQEMTTEIREWFGIEITDSFFDFGNLQEQVSLISQSTDYYGSDQEIDKHDKFCDLQYKMAIIKLLKIFADTFDSIYVLPFLVHNNSSQADEEITIDICVDQGVAIHPSCELFNPQYCTAGEYTGLEGMVYEQGLIKELLLLPTDPAIQYDSDISYDIQDTLRESQKNIRLFFSRSMPSATVEDYEYEIKKCVADTTESSDCIYEFDISALRPQEKKWLGPVILLKPDENGMIAISYSIKSKHSSGVIEGSIKNDDMEDSH